MADTNRLVQFTHDFTHLVDQVGQDEARLFELGIPLLKALVAQDDWLPAQCSRAGAGQYQQYLLYCDPGERFCVVSFVWGPGQTTPIHDHTVWGMIGVLQGEELCEEFQVEGENLALTASGSHRLSVGEVDLVSPRVGDIHRVSNALDDQASISIHVYGANIGKVERHVYDPDTGAKTAFTSGYSDSEPVVL